MAWLYKRPDSKVWWIGYRANGKQHLRSTKTTDEAEAKKELGRVEAMFTLHQTNSLTLEVFETLTGRALPAKTLKAALSEWLQEARGSTGVRTVEKYEQLEGEFLAWMESNGRPSMVAQVTRDDVQAFLTSKRESISAATVNMRRKCLAIFFKRCLSAGTIRDNPMNGVKMFKVSRHEEKVRRPFTFKELSSLHEAAPDDFWRYMVLAGFYTGLRLGDLATIPIGAINLRTRRIGLRARKTGQQMTIPIAPPLHRLLTKILAERKGAKASDSLWPEQAQRYEETGSGWLSNQFYERVLVPAGLASKRTHSAKKAKSDGRRRVNEISFHCFRHSCVTMHAALGQNQQTVKTLAGHSSDEVNDLYTSVPLDVLTKAVAKLPDITK